MTPDERQAAHAQINRECDQAFLRNVTRDMLRRKEPLRGGLLAFALAAIEAFDFDRDGHRLPPPPEGTAFDLNG